MISIFLIFIITLVMSYLATIPPGPLSIFVIHSALKSNFKIALLAGLGGALCEMGYAYLATISLAFFETRPTLHFWLQRAIILILFLIGLFTFFQKNNTVKRLSTESNTHFISFLKGISLSLFNPALFAFWVVILVGVQQYPFIEINTNFQKFAFIFGAGCGTFFLVYTYALIAIKKREKIFKYLNNDKLNKATGLIFIALSIFQLVDLLSK